MENDNSGPTMDTQSEKVDYYPDIFFEELPFVRPAPILLYTSLGQSGAQNIRPC